MNGSSYPKDGGEELVPEPQEFIDMDRVGSSPTSATSPTFAPRGTRTGRDTLSKTVAVDMHSADDHIWLMDHEIGRPVQMKRFSTVSQFAGHARELAGPPPEPRGSRRNSVLSPQHATTADGVASGLVEPSAAGEHEVAGLDMISCNVVADVIPALINVRRGRPLRSHYSTSRASSSSSSTSSRLGKQSCCGSSCSSSCCLASLTQSFWLDVQTSDVEVVREILALFPVHTSTIDEVLEPVGYDNVEVFVMPKYAFVTIKAKGKIPRPLDDFSEYLGDTAGYSDEFVVCSVICFEDWIITIHASPFAGLAECVKKIQHAFGPRRWTGSTGKDPDARVPLMTASWVLHSLVVLVVDTFLPDPTVVLAEVDRVDEMVLLIAPGDRDQPDLLRQVALLRRSISTQRALLFKKEQLLQQLLMPLMRTCFVTSNPAIAQAYKRCQSQIIHNSERLDAARDVLNQANANFVSGVSVSMSKASTNVDFRMQLLAQIAIICLPMNLVAGMFGMNVMVPDRDGENLTSFFIIVGCMGLWVVVCLIFIVYDLRNSRSNARSIVVDG